MCSQGYLFSDDDSQPFKREKGFFEPGKKSARKPARKSVRKSPSKSRKSPAQPKTETPAPQPEPPADAQPRQYTVSQLARLIKFTLKESLPPKMLLAAEISNCKHHGSGHLYLTLKDEDAQLPAVMWKSQAARLKFRPADGMAVLATGSIDLYEPHGKIQFYIERLEPAGLGALELAFKQLADKLRREGLFDDRHKKPLPPFPLTVAIVTSPTGAAIQDITRTLNRRFRGVRKLLYPAAVQGESAAPAIARAIIELNRRRSELAIDVMIIGRGGGSIEDLWAFNEEIVARAIFASDIPVISGVGHEVDTTIADLVADARAATPTAAAAQAVPDSRELQAGLRQIHQRLYHGTTRRVQQNDHALHRLVLRPVFSRPTDLLRTPRQRIDESQARLAAALNQKLRNAARGLDRRAQTLQRIEPHRALRDARRRLTDNTHQLDNALAERLRSCRRDLTAEAARLTTASPKQRAAAQRREIDFLRDRLTRSGRHRLHGLSRQLTAETRRLQNLNPRAVLKRGYSITRRKDSAAILRPGEPLKPGDLILTELADDTTLESQITQPPAPKDSNP